VELQWDLRDMARFMACYVLCFGFLKTMRPRFGSTRSQLIIMLQDETTMELGLEDNNSEICLLVEDNEYAQKLCDDDI
jgi:hypothetical protein